MFIFILDKHLIWTSPDGLQTWYYSDQTTWIVSVLALAWLAWFLVRRYLRARALRRRPRHGADYRLKRTARVKHELSSQYLRPGFSANIHGVGIGVLDGGNDYCIQVFVINANDELWPGSGAVALPNSYRGIPLLLIEMSRSAFLSSEPSSSFEMGHKNFQGIRDHQEVIIGGISGANTNLTGQSGTIGYFCTRKSKLRRRREIHMLSNSHVFADLRKTTVDDRDLIMQPSPGEPAANRPIGTLVYFSGLKFDGDLTEPNHVDAAVARLWAPLHKPLIPLIGAIKGHVATKDIEIGEAVRKFGRTTGYTEGQIFSICLDIWIRYDRTGQSAFFTDQFLIEPNLQQFKKFAAPGDSGSLVVDAEQHAIGLIFAGMSELPETLQVRSGAKEVAEVDPATDTTKRIEGYGVANPIAEVLDRLKIDLLRASPEG
jgi:hypothetical protein